MPNTIMDKFAEKQAQINQRRIEVSSHYSGTLVEQEADCRHLAKEKGLTVVHVYRDVEKYRVGNKSSNPPGGNQSIALFCYDDELLFVLKQTPQL